MGIHGPCLTAIEQGAEDAGIVHSHLHLHSQLGFVHTLDVRQASVVAAFPILLLISGSRERLSVMVDPRYMNW